MTPASAYDPNEWHEFFIGSAGAAAALSGLIFVAVSVNTKAIFAAERQEGGRFLTGRALEALVALLLVVAVSLVGLATGIAGWTFGAFVIAMAALSAVSPVRAIVAVRRSRERPVGMTSRFILAAAYFAALLVAGISVVVGVGGGLYWLPAAFLLAIVVAGVNAWVLLVEVLR